MIGGSLKQQLFFESQCTHCPQVREGKENDSLENSLGSLIPELPSSRVLPGLRSVGFPHNASQRVSALLSPCASDRHSDNACGAQCTGPKEHFLIQVCERYKLYSLTNPPPAR